MADFARRTATIASELNNLLTVIEASVEQLSADAPNSSQQEAISFIERALSGGVHLAAQLHSMAAGQSAPPVVLDVADHVAALAAQLERRLPPGVQLRTRFEAELALVRAESIGLTEALEALVDNAVDALQGTGAISIEVEEVALHGWSGQVQRVPHQPFVMVAVFDTGEGMGTDCRVHAFEPRFSTREARMGMGLTRVRAFAREHGGMVRLDSSRGEGTCVCIYLPIVTSARLHALRDRRQRVSELLPSKQTVLLVDDDAPVRRALRRVLTSEGYAVVEAASGEQALGILELRADDIGVVVSDVMMPQMNGIELLNAVQTRWPACPRVLVSGQSPAGLDLSSLGQVPFVQKPATKTELLHAVELATGSEIPSEASAC